MAVKEYVLDIWFDDRLGLGYEMFSIFKEASISVLGMEVRHERVSFKFECLSSGELRSIIDSIKKIDGVKKIDIVDLMPYEEREQQLSTILNCVSEGIIAVDQDGMITHMNGKAKQIINAGTDDLIGKHAGSVMHHDIPMLQTIDTGKSYSLHEIKFKRGRKIIHYLTSGVPIYDKNEKVIGAVATLKDYKQVEEIISKVDKLPSSAFHGITYQNAQMRNIIETVKIISKSTSTVLIRGESGTGKELFARSVHMESNRADKPFVIVNCAALPESLLESELFGYVEGSFTGAVKGGKKGLFEQANKGTLFLDEIGELSLHMQVRLLRVLQEKTIRKIGSDKEVHVDVRIIAATHRNLEEMVDKETFREDLYYRLNVVPLYIPPLRKRKEDIPLLVNQLAQKIARKLDRKEIVIDNEGMKFLIDQRWPGNVRQLENTLERVVNIVRDSVITLRDIKEWTNLSEKRSENFPDKRSVDHQPFIDDADYKLSINLKYKEKIPYLKEIVGEVERKVLSEVLKVHNSSRKAGKVLDISNTTVINKMHKYGISSPQILIEQGQ